MNANQVINMVIRMVMTRLVRSGVNAGMNAVGGRMTRNKASGDQQATRKGNGGPDSGETQKRMKQAMRVSRRIGRF